MWLGARCSRARQAVAYSAVYFASTSRMSPGRFGYSAKTSSSFVTTMSNAVSSPGVSVPLHSHDDYEGFFIVSGSQQVLVPGEQGLTWVEAHAGDYVQIPGGAPHAHRNVTAEPAVDLIVTTARLGRFFRDVGRPVTEAGPSPSPERVARFVEVAAAYGYWLGSPEENAAVGIDVPAFAG